MAQAKLDGGLTGGGGDSNSDKAQGTVRFQLFRVVSLRVPLQTFPFKYCFSAENRNDAALQFLGLYLTWVSVEVQSKLVSLKGCRPTWKSGSSCDEVKGN